VQFPVSSNEVTGEGESVPDRVRSACAWVAGRADAVAIDEAAVEAYAADLPAAARALEPEPPPALAEADRETQIACVVCLDAINFGSGWWPTIRKHPGRSGYFTIATALEERFRAQGAWSADELCGLDAAAVATVLGQPPKHPLMAQYAASLRDVGEHVAADHDGRFEALVDDAAGSALALVDSLAAWDAFADVSTYEGRPIPFYKRAQIAAADLNRAGIADLRGEERLTAFADNLVPHVLRVDGVLRLAPALERRIEAGDPLEHGSGEEVELRACAVHAVELLAAACEAELLPAQIDAALWNRGRGERYKAIPRPRCRNTAY
jgi:Potential Queuosine, Q, salvage protein family